MPNLLSTLVAHFGFGGATGALFAAVPTRWRDNQPITTGIAYGLGVLAGSYLGWVPAFGLMPSALRQPKSRNAMMIGAHVVWGASLGLAFQALQSRSDNAGGTAPTELQNPPQ
jgi:uncharacterized membrane protein YagU involved in acid resistance